MKPLALAVLLLSAPSVRADETAAPPAAAPEAAPAPELIALERTLTEKQEARSRGQLDPEQYKEFVAKFRSDLDAVLERVPPSAENKGAHARILSRLGDRERSQALAGLDQALTENPNSCPLLIAKGHILLEQKDYPAAAESARQAWESSKHTDMSAFALLKLSEGRIAPVGYASGAVQVTVRQPERTTTIADGFNPDNRASKRAHSTNVPSPVPSSYKGDLRPVKEVGTGPGLLATAGIMAGVLMLAWGAAPQDSKEKIRQLVWEAPKQELKYAAGALAGAAVLYGGWTLVAAVPTIAPVAPAAGELVFSGAGTGVGAGTLGTTIAWQQAAAGALKAGTITLAAGKAINIVSDARAAHRASQSDGSSGDQKGNNASEPSLPPQPKPKSVFLPIPISSSPDTKDCSLRSGENVLSRFIDGTRLAPGFLLRHEGALLGHTIERHVRKKPEYLRNRLRDDGIDDASTFFDQLTAERVIKAAVLRNIPRITAWSAKPFDDTQLPVLYEGSHLVPVGNSVTWQNPDMLLPRYDAMVRLQRVPGCRIFIVTAFPQ